MPAISESSSKYENFLSITLREYTSGHRDVKIECLTQYYLA